MDTGQLKRYYYDERAPWVDPDISHVKQLYMGDLEPEDKLNHGYLCEVPHTTWGDYYGATVERSNHRSWLRMFEESQGDKWWDVYGGFHSHMIVVSRECIENPRDDTDYDMIDVISDLFTYPCINDEDMSDLEMEIEDEAWKDGWVKMDLCHELLERQVITCEELDDLEDDDLRRMFHQAMENAETYPLHEDAISVYYDFQTIVAHWPTTSAKEN